MTNPIPFELTVANSNPNSRFSHFEIVCAVDCKHPRFDDTYTEVVESAEELEEHPYTVGDPFYVLYGRYAAEYAPHPVHVGARELGRFANLKDAKELLVELNGPIVEDQDEE